MMEYRALRDSTGHVGDVKRLSENLAEDGYLLLRRLLDPHRVLQVKRDVMGVLHETHIIEGKDTEDPMWSGGPHPSEAEHMRYYDKIVRLDSFNRLAESPEIVAVMENVIGEAVTVWEQRLIRVMFPDPDSADDVGVGTHQDGAKNLGYQADRFYTCWLPLMDIDPNIGGLAIALGSHKMGFLEHAGSSPSDAKKARSKGFGLDSTEFAWGTSDYHPGDAIFFGHVTAHRGLVEPLRPDPALVRFPLPVRQRHGQLDRPYAGARRAAGRPEDRRRHHQPRALRDHPRGQGNAAGGPPDHAGGEVDVPGTRPGTRCRGWKTKPTSFMNDIEADIFDLVSSLAPSSRLPLLLLAAFLTPGLAGNETDRAPTRSLHENPALQQRHRLGARERHVGDAASPGNPGARLRLFRLRQ